MLELKEKYVTDSKGSRVAVLLDVADYERLLEEVEELESIRAYDATKACHDEVLPFEQAVSEIEKSR